MSIHESDQESLDGLPGLPTELLMLIGEHLPNRSLNRLIRVNRRTYEALIDLLYRRNIQQQRSSALLWAARKNYVEVVCRLLRLGADVNALGMESHQRVESALSQQIKRTVFSRSEVMNADYYEVLAQGVSPLLTAVWTDNLRLVKILLKAVARLDPPLRKDFLAPLALAIKRGNISISRVLVNALEDINTCVLPGWTAVAIASKYQQVEILRYLFQKGAIPNVTDRVFTGLLTVGDLRRERLQQFLKGDLDDLNEIVYRHRIDDAPLQILRLLMHHGLEPSEEQKQQGQTHSDPRVRYLFHDPQTNKDMKRTGRDHDAEATAAHEALKDDFPPISPDKEASSGIENSVWNDAKMHELKRSFAPGSKFLHNSTTKQSLFKKHVLAEEHNLSEEHTRTGKRTPMISDPFPLLRPIPPEKKKALESQSHIPVTREAKSAHEDPLNNWKIFRENITVPKTSSPSSEPSRQIDKRKKKGKWTALEL